MSDVVKRFLAKGYAFPCACCEKLWSAQARGMDACEAALSGQDCGGPIAGMSFPLYQGPLTIQSLATRCFICGEPADEAVTTPAQQERFVGVCKRHVPTLDRLVVDEDLHIIRRAAGG